MTPENVPNWKRKKMVGEEVSFDDLPQNIQIQYLKRRFQELEKRVNRIEREDLFSTSKKIG